MNRFEPFLQMFFFSSAVRLMTRQDMYMEFRYVTRGCSKFQVGFFLGNFNETTRMPEALEEKNMDCAHYKTI